MGYAPILQYQWNPKRNEFDLFAVIHDRPISDSLMDKQACDALWAAFKESSLYVNRFEEETAVPFPQGYGVQFSPSLNLDRAIDVWEMSIEQF
ncbi:hypothetical protein QUB63_19095 [Microcoleus sp. ARI1-B5]|uniref:hypothetical protein n=1 Tax=unclassified Microcoleus TaxID=2642155 RepID=UPI002FD0AFAA